MIIERQPTIEVTPGPSVADGQICSYVADPNSELVLPNDINQDAIAYKQGEAGAIFTWNKTEHVWY